MIKLTRRTDWIAENEVFNNQYRVSGRKWLDLECKRINSKGDRPTVEVIKRPGFNEYAIATIVKGTDNA